MGECSEIGVTDLGEEFLEPRPGVDVRAEHDGVHEHADERVQRTLTATGEGRADRQIVAARKPRQDHCECRVDHHVTGDASTRREAVDAVGDVGGDLERRESAATGGDLRTRPIRREVDHVRQARELLGPICELTTDRRFGVARRPEDFTLPERVVRVLDFERLEDRSLPRGSRDVRADQVADQRRERLTVGSDVVHHHGEDVFAR